MNFRFKHDKVKRGRNPNDKGGVEKVKLKELTEQLLQHLVQLKEQYETQAAPENKKDASYFEFVKKETDPIFDRLETWETEALEMVKSRTINVHPQQV